MAGKKNKELFTLCVKVSDTGKNISTSVSCMKDGKESDFRLLEGDNLGTAYESLAYAASLFANLWIRKLHQEGKISDETFNTFMGKNKHNALDDIDMRDSNHEQAE